MATYGDFPGVRITTSGGGLTGVEVGAEEKLVIFGRGGTTAEAPAHEPTQINSLSDADRKFGAGSPLAEAVKQALANGANRNYLYGVIAQRTTVTDEDITGGGTAENHTGGSKISNLPIEESTDDITVTDGTDAELDVEFRYETNTDDTNTDFTSLSPDGDTIFINPLTGEWVADAAGNYEVTYNHFEYQQAFDAADSVLNEGETGIYAALTESPDTHGKLAAKVDSMRNNFQMVNGVAGALPNRTHGTTGEAAYDAESYSDTTDHDSLFLVAPARQQGYDGQPSTIIGAVGGIMAGHPITDPVYNDTLSGLGDLGQILTKSEADNLRDEQVIPIRQGGSIRIKSNMSTSTESDWTRDFWRRRIVDRVLLVSKQVGDDTVGRINDEESREDAENTIYGQLSTMVDDRLLKPNTETETRWYVEVTEDAGNSDEINIDVGITPQGIVKRIDETVTINT